MTRLRLLLLVEGGSFLTAALVHFGVLLSGYEHRQAGNAESVIGGVLLAGLAFIWLRPAWGRTVGIAAQAFALLGTLVGAVMIAIGVGPRSAPDLVYHLSILTLLAWGLRFAIRLPGAERRTALPGGERARTSG
jgi:hypothetical protein